MRTDATNLERVDRSIAKNLIPPPRFSKKRKRIKRANHEIPITIFGHRLFAFSQSQNLRFLVQLGFLALVIWIGYDFVRFVKWAESGDLANPVARPPGVEVFLPITALISFKYWIYTGIINNIHPAALVIFLTIVGVSFFVGKAFCSWVCPIGLLSESFASTGEKIFGRNLRVPRWLDYPLRSLKYLLLLFFVWSIFALMDLKAVETFIYSPYNRVADIKMLKFFQQMTRVTAWTLLILAGLSILIKHFWCRYLCPYGALLGVVGLFSPVKITRNIPSCIDCELCTKACPAGIQVHKLKKVISDECTSCLSCIDACPVADTLFLAAPAKKRISPVVAALVIALMFPLAMMLAKATGHWQNAISSKEYSIRAKELNRPIYEHNRGRVIPDPDPNRFKD